MAYPSIWLTRARRPRPSLRDWRGILVYGLGGLLTLAMVLIVIGMIWFLVMVFVQGNDGDKDPPLKSIVGAPAGEEGIGDALRSGDR